MAKTKEQRLKEVHDRAMDRFRRAYPSQWDIRLQCQRDRRFVYVPGAQWEGDLEQQFANRPRYQVNKVYQSVRRIFAEYRNNRITVDFRAETGASEEMAETLDGLYRADEQYCNAQEAYDNAFDEAISGGFGAWRLCTEYEDEEDEDDDKQRIKIAPVWEADVSVFFDIDAKRQDKADAKWCFVLSSMERHAYEEEYGTESTGFNMADNLNFFDWFQPDIVWIAEYYEIEKERKTINIYMLPATGEEVRLEQDEDEEAAFLEAQGYILARTKKISKRRVHKYIIDGEKVQEDCGLIAGKYIPIIPMYGNRGYVDNIERIQGHIRNTADLTRLYNMLVSLLAEISVYSPIEKPILMPEQIQGHEMVWARDNIDRNAYLLLNPMTDANGQMTPGGPVGYTKPPAIPPALIGLLELCNIDMKELLGNNEAGEQVVSNISARAIELINNRLDMQSFVYMDNMSKAMRHCGRVWLEMARDIYIEEGREMTGIGSDGTEFEVELMKPVIQDGGVSYENDLTSGKYEVVVDVGPSFTTRRDGTVRALASLLQFVEDPAERAAITGVVLQNMDGEGLQDLKQYNRKKLVSMGVVKPNEKEQEELDAQAANQQPDPQAIYLMAEAQKATANAEKAQADTVKALADSEKTQAETAKIMTEIDNAKLDQILKVLAEIRSGGQAPIDGVDGNLTQQ